MREINVSIIEDNLRKNKVLNNLYFFDEIDSTNDFLKSKSENGMIALTLKQMAGKGRLGRVWEDDKGSLLFSILLINEKYHNISELTLIVGLLVSRVINSKIKGKTYIKWPNDIILNNKKVGGILTEAVFKNNKLDKTIIGIGLNIYNEKFSNEIKEKASSLYLEGEEIDINELFLDIIKTLENNIDTFINYGFEKYRDEYIDNCINMKKEVMYEKKGQFFTGVVVDITNKGELIIDNNGKKDIIISNEISLRTKNGYI